MMFHCFVTTIINWQKWVIKYNAETDNGIWFACTIFKNQILATVFWGKTMGKVTRELEPQELSVHMCKMN